MRSFLIAACLVLFASTPALAGGGFFSRALDNAAIRQGRRQGLREAARVQAFRANIVQPVRVRKFVAPVHVQRFVSPVYAVPVQSFAVPVYGVQRFRSVGGCH